MHPALAHQEHRPWPIPARPWTWRQSWLELLFAHWPVPAAAVRSFVPAELEIDEFEGSTFIGVVPFRMTGVMRRYLPELPGVSAFPELNVRLYVRYRDRPGVWFLSLDAGNALAVWAARRFFHLPYFHSRMSLEYQGDAIVYRSKRRQGPAARFEGRYAPTGEVFEAKPGTLDAFLVERYCLYTKDASGTLYRGEIHHRPWPLQQAEAEINAAGLLGSHGLVLAGPPPLLLFSRGVDVAVWPLARVGLNP